MTYALYYAGLNNGSYSLQLNTFFFGTTGLAGTVAAGQTGTIPPDSKSLLFNAAPDLVYGADYPTLSITFAGEPLPFIRLATTEKYETFGIDISGHAGETGELLFRAVEAAEGVGVRAIIDDIRFSPEPIPEPSATILLPVGLALIGVCRTVRRLEGTPGKVWSLEAKIANERAKWTDL